MSNSKFRAWDDLNKRWLLGYDREKLGGFSMIGEVMLFGEYTKMLNSFSLKDLDFVKLMQYTGLKDKNGKEIYEGDVVKVINTMEMKSPHTSDVGIAPQGVLIWAHPGHIKMGLGKTRLLSGYCDQEPIEGFDVSCEVIGNIYENPELLTQ